MKATLLVLIASGFLGAEPIQAQQPPPAPPPSPDVPDLLRAMVRDAKRMAAEYSGTVRYRHQITGPSGVDTEQASVTIQEGQAHCGGGHTSVGPTESKTLPILGPGLFDITFQKPKSVFDIAMPPNAKNRTYTEDEIERYRDQFRHGDQIVASYMEYSFWVACPNVLSDAAPEADYRHSFESYKVGFDSRPGFPPPRLTGSWSIPAPETDPENNVGGVLEMSWDLCACMPMEVVDLNGAGVGMTAETWNVIIKVEVHDKKAPYAPVSGANVTGSVFNDPERDTLSCITGGGGYCIIHINGIPLSRTRVTWSVANVEAPGRIYAPPNKDRDGDSDGTALTIAQP